MLTPSPESTALRPALSVLDLVLLNVSTIVGLRWISTAAQVGPAGLSLWLLASLVFFLPSALAVQELSSRIPHVGGLYLWTQRAFGDTHGFLAGWAYVLSNLVFLPSLLLFISGILLHILGQSWLGLADSPVYNGLVCMGFLWGATFMNVLGLQRAKWIQNLGGVSTLAAAGLLLLGGLLVYLRFGSATPVTVHDLVPNLTALPTLGTFSILILGYVGLELGPILGDEIKDSARSVRRATLISALVIAVIYMAGTATLLAALPVDRIGAISGIPQAMASIGERAGIRHFGVVAAILMAVSAIGGLSAWIGGTARLPFVMGLGHYLPQRLASLHPRHLTPHVALWWQAGLTSVVMLIAIAGSAVHEAYLLLIDMTAALNCLVWIYLFAALGVLRHRAAGREESIALIPGGPLVCYGVAFIGALAMVFATVFSLIPPAGSDHPGLFVLKGVGGCALVFASGYLVARKGQRGLS